jgi:hypothetical protein
LVRLGFERRSNCKTTAAEILTAQNYFDEEQLIINNSEQFSLFDHFPELLSFIHKNTSSA